MNAARHASCRLLRRLAFGLSLVFAIAAVLAAYRYRVPEGAVCAIAPQRIEAAPDSAPSAVSVTRYRFEFTALRAGDAGLAISIGEAVPFYRLQLNGADLTPQILLERRDLRDLAPHFHRLPPDVVRAGRNVAVLELPDDRALGRQRLSQLCAGDAVALYAAFRANWWRMVGIPRLCALVLGMLALLAAAGWLLSARHTAYAWYFACILLMLVRTIYVSTGERPGTPLLCAAIDSVAIALQPYFFYRFMRDYWHLLLPLPAAVVRIGTLLALCSCVLMALLPQLPGGRLVYLGAVLVSTGASLFAVGAVSCGVGRLQGREHGVALWTAVFAYAVALPEIANLFLPFEQRWMWTAPVAHVALAVGFGHLLLRRLVLGADLLRHAARAAADDLDGDAAPAEAWTHLSARLRRRERGRLIRDIHDGFGSRLVAILQRARREVPQAEIQRSLQRALLDMRLMIDALDESSRSLGVALAGLRHRLEPVLALAGIAADWQLSGIDDVRIDDRRCLIGLFRCVEELLGNAAVYAGCRVLAVEVRVIDEELMLRVSDADSGGDRPVRGDIAPLRALVERYGGRCYVAAADGRQFACTLQFALF
ncbi:sensor histidine kinase [Tahibacter harae]|uniref:histidine kinase n=1 Tax=Tahibacter harae TaxID=2963937 RepID=A0ABT1QT95_9GAMM|nr:hypothetical protein [Tahibacter harae]MCQ4165515.1 hypothetical protein [Tahibacter harae]